MTDNEGSTNDMQGLGGIGQGLPTQGENVSGLQLLAFIAEQNRQRDEFMINVVNACNVQQAPVQHYYSDPSKSIKEFNGIEDSYQSEMWLTNVNFVCDLSNADDKSRLNAVRSKLTAGALDWFVTNATTFTTWSDFENLFKEVFIGEIDQVDAIRIMQERKQGSAESSQVYFHRKVKLCTDAKISFASAKKQIAIGLINEDLCLYLINRQHADFTGILKDIRCYEQFQSERKICHGTSNKKGNPNSTSGNFGTAWKSGGLTRGSCKQGDYVANSNYSRGQYSEPSSSTPSRSGSTTTTTDSSPARSFKDRKCYNCNKYGHISKHCTQPKKPRVCEHCKQDTHFTNQCPNKPKSGVVENKQGVYSVQSDVSGTTVTKYLKEAMINGRKLQAFIDTGSSSCTIQASAAVQLCAPIQQTTESLYGFGDFEKAATKVLGTLCLDIEIDGVVGKRIGVLVVPDKAQPVELLVGRPWLELPDIAYMKIGEQLIIKYTDSFNNIVIDPPTHVKITVAETTKLNQNSINLVMVRSNFCANTTVMVEDEGYSVGKLFELKNGSTTVPVMNDSFEDKTLKSGINLMRADIVDVITPVMELEKAQLSLWTDRFMPDSVVENNIVMPSTLNAISNQINTQDNASRSVHQRIERSDLVLGDALEKTEVCALVEIVNEFRNCFALSMDELGCTNVTQMNIQEKEGSTPVCSKAYRATTKEREEIAKIIGEYKKYGLVKETRSPYASPVLLVRKKTGEFRLVIDYRKLNKQTVADKFPLPNIDEQLENLTGAQFFSVLDLAHGYMQIPLSEEAKAKTAFITPDTTGQFERMIFGLTNGPAEFQRLMNKVLGNLRNSIAMCYLDDILIPSKDFQEMLSRLRLVFQALREANLTCRLSKCEFCSRKVDFLGFVIERGQLKPGSRKVAAIREFPVPTNLCDVQRFLGLTGFFRRFIVQYSSRAEPLSRLTRKNEKFCWNNEQQRSFEDLKTALTTEPVLQLYNPKACTEVHTDASSTGIAGMLLQEGDDKKFHLVYAVSKKTTPTERDYHSSKLELLAMVYTMERLRQFLLPISFTLVTDCQALIYMNINRTTNHQIARWYTLFQDYDVIEVRHRPGVRMAHVDALSRAPIDNEGELIEVEDIIVDKLEVLQVMNLEDKVLMYQYADEDLKRKIDILKKAAEDRTEQEKNRTKDFRLDKGRLIKEETDVEGRKKQLFVLPESMRKSITVRYHDQLGHFAVDRVVAKIREHYWFAGMRRYVKHHIKRCLDCLMIKTQAGKQPGLLHPIPPGDRPFDIIHVDHVGPFVRSTRGNQEILVIIDNLTKYVTINACKNTSAQELVKCMTDFINERGIPRKMISDQGTCYTSQLFERFCEERGIEHINISTRHPQANGQCERVNRTLVPLVAISVERPDSKDWDHDIKRIQRDLNAAVNKTTGKCPFELLYGYSPRFNDGALRSLTTEQENYETPVKLQALARKRILDNHKLMKTYYDKSHHDKSKFIVGQIVVMEKPPTHTGESTKLQPKFRGPLVITRVFPGDTYRVQQIVPETGRFYCTTPHVTKLKTWSGRTVDLDEPDTNSETESGTDL